MTAAGLLPPQAVAMRAQSARAARSLARVGEIVGVGGEAQVDPARSASIHGQARRGPGALA